MAGCFCRLQGISDDCIKEAPLHPFGWAVLFLVKADIQGLLCCLALIKAKIYN